MEAKLVILEGKFQGCEIPILNTVQFIGRDANCHVCLHSPAVSKRHCAVVAWAGKVRVRDLQSRNGTLVNGQPIVGEVSVRDGDELQIANHRFVFRIAIDPAAPTVAPPDERALDWLLQTSAATRDAASHTAVLPPPAEADESSRAVSGGRLLRDFVAKHTGGAR